MRRFRIMSALLILALSSMLTTGIQAQTFQIGDVFASISCGEVNWFSNTGVLKATLNTGVGNVFTTGMCFDQFGNLYVTAFNGGVVSKFNNHGNLIASNWATCNGYPESIVESQAGNFYVGQVVASTHILEFNSAGGAAVNSWAPATENVGTDWIDLAADQCTMYYTSEGLHIKRFDVCTNTQLADFVTLSGGGRAFAHRIRPDGTVLVAESDRVEYWSADGSTLLNTYLASTYNMAASLFALNLDPDGTSFWTSDFSDNLISRINIATGALITQFNAQACGGNYGLAVFGELHVCPDVQTQPSNDTVCPGNTASFTAAANQNPTVQWQVSTDGGSTWNNVSGATSTTYSFTATNSEFGNQYRAVFTDTVSGNQCSPVTSGAGTLIEANNCCTSPSLTTNPSNDSVCRGSMGSFTAAASGNPTPTVQWMRSTNGGATWTNISGATSTTYTTGNVTTSMNGYEYEAVFTNNCSPGTATTTAATLSVTTPPVLTSSPPEPAENVCEGNTASFSASASGTPTPTPQWQVSTDLGATWTNIPGANSTTLSFPTTRSMTGYYYRSVLTNGCGSVTSRNGYLVVHYAPGYLTNPSNVSTRAGGSVLFNSTATGYLTPTVQWQVSTNGGGSWSNISGATANTLHLLNVTAGMSGNEYHAVFTNSCGTWTSNPATLTVN